MFRVPPLSQSDPKWKDKKLGVDATSTIGMYGCLLTCMTMVANGFGEELTPALLDDKLVNIGGFLGDLVRPALLPDVASRVHYKNFVRFNDQPAALREIDAALAAGMPVIIEVDNSPAPGMQNHWIILYDKRGDDYLFQDPWPYPPPQKEYLLSKRYAFSGKPKNIIRSALFYTGVAQGKPSETKSTPPKKPILKEGLFVYSTVDGLAFRTQPVVDDSTLIKRVNIGARFISLEREEQAREKIGVNDQWLNAQDAEEGYEGYVAAWYLATGDANQPPTGISSGGDQQTEAAPESQPTPPSESSAVPTAPSPPQTKKSRHLIVYTAVDGLALRSQPVISPDNLIKREPQNAELQVLEPIRTARQKIGQQNQWLRVGDIGGTTGYVAAWYVLATQEPALGTDEKNGAPPEQGADQASSKFILRTTVDALALRSQPVITPATLIKRFPVSSELLALEPPEAVEKKLGVMNQWIKVRDIHGNEGYVAAWYVMKNPKPAPYAQNE